MGIVVAGFCYHDDSGGGVGSSIMTLNNFQGVLCLHRPHSVLTSFYRKYAVEDSLIAVL